MVNGQPPSPGWSPTPQKLPEGSVVHTLNLESRPNALRPASKVWSPTFTWMVTHHHQNGHPSSKVLSPILQNMVIHNLKHGHPPTKINQILKDLKKLQPNKEFDTSTAQLVSSLFGVNNINVLMATVVTIRTAESELFSNSFYEAFRTSNKLELSGLKTREILDLCAIRQFSNILFVL